LLAAQEAGADLIELGIPFSDPTAEGPVIQTANVKALEGGVTTDRIFEFVEQIRGKIRVPLVFMTYANVIFSYGKDGSDGFCRRCSEAGIDGLIVADVPFEEKEEFDLPCKRWGLDFISMIAPTSEDRIQKIAAQADGFIYVVSSMGVTGVRSEITTDIAAITARIREVTDVPCAVGFGISTPEQAARMAACSDGAIVGSAIIRLISRCGRDAAPEVGRYIKSMKEAVKAAGA
jgi:tryptophan synthase alpha chain